MQCICECILKCKQSPSALCPPLLSSFSPVRLVGPKTGSCVRCPLPYGPIESVTRLCASVVCRRLMRRLVSSHSILSIRYGALPHWGSVLFVNLFVTYKLNLQNSLNPISNISHSISFYFIWTKVFGWCQPAQDLSNPSSYSGVQGVDRKVSVKYSVKMTDIALAHLGPE